MFKRLARYTVLITIVAMLLVWAAVVRLFGIPAYLLPPPERVIGIIIEDWREILYNLWVTFSEAILGLGFAVIVGVPLGAIIVLSKSASRILYPLVVSSQAVPKVALAPLLLVWFGYGLTPKVIVAALIAFFPIVVTTAGGLASVSEDSVNLIKSMGGRRLDILRRVQLPYALPSMMSGFKLAVASSVVGAVVGEFVGANEGLGFLLQSALGNFAVAKGFAILLILMLMGIGMFYLAVLIERRIAYWPVAEDISALAKGVTV